MLADMTGLSYVQNPLTGAFETTTIDPMTGMMTVSAPNLRHGYWTMDGTTSC